MGVKRALPAGHEGAGYHIANGQAVSGTATFHSPKYDSKFVDNIGLQVNFSGTMAGTFSVECSIDNANWSSLTFNPALPQPSGSGISFLVDIQQTPFPYLRVSYTNASGSGTLDVWLSAKDLN